MAQLIFEGADGRIIQPSEEDLPYDVKGDKIQIEAEDFGIWYVDALDHPERYDNKVVHFKARILRTPAFPKGSFVRRG